MNTTPELPQAPAGARATMNGKPVFTVDAKTVINFESGFSHKLLCDGPTFSTGSACVYKCAFCYVPDMMRKLRAIPQMAHVHGAHEDIVIRRKDSLDIMRRQLTDRHGRPKFTDPADNRVIYASPLVDVAGNVELVRETIEACKLILELTHWQIRLLSKSNLLPLVAKAIEAADPGRPRGELFTHRPPSQAWKARVIFGVSTGTLDDGLAAVFEEETPKVSKRIQSLHWLQDHGFRTFGMVCPSLPQADYPKFAREMAAAIRADQCEQVWAEIINARGESMTRTINALVNGGFEKEAQSLELVSRDKSRWECYARATFLAHTSFIQPSKLRFLQYAGKQSQDWWTVQRKYGAILL